MQQACTVRRIPRRDFAAQSAPSASWPDALVQLWRICRAAEATYLETLLPAAGQYGPALDPAIWQGYSDAAYSLWRAVESSAHVELLIWEQRTADTAHVTDCPADRSGQVREQTGEQGVTA